MSDLNFHARTAIANRLRKTYAAVTAYDRGEEDLAAVGTVLAELRFQSRITAQIAPLEAGALRGTADLVELAVRGAQAAAKHGDRIRRYDERCREALKVLELAREVILPKD